MFKNSTLLRPLNGKLRFLVTLGVTLLLQSVTAQAAQITLAWDANMDKFEQIIIVIQYLIQVIAVIRELIQEPNLVPALSLTAVLLALLLVLRKNKH